MSVTFAASSILVPRAPFILLKCSVKRLRQYILFFILGDFIHVEMEAQARIDKTAAEYKDIFFLSSFFTYFILGTRMDLVPPFFRG